MKYISIDIETCGLDNVNHDIVEFAAVMDDLANPQPIEKLPTFHAYIKKNMYTGDPFALAMHAEIFRRIVENDESKYRFVYIDELMTNFRNWLSMNDHPFDLKSAKYKINVAGKNAASFDIPFLKNKITDWSGVQFNHRVLDPSSLYFDPKIDEILPDSKTCMERAGLDGKVAHTALEDALAVVKMIRHKYLT